MWDTLLLFFLVPTKVKEHLLFLVLCISSACHHNIHIIFIFCWDSLRALILTLETISQNFNWFSSACFLCKHSRYKLKTICLAICYLVTVFSKYFFRFRIFLLTWGEIWYANSWKGGQIINFFRGHFDSGLKMFLESAVVSWRDSLSLLKVFA